MGVDGIVSVLEVDVSIGSATVSWLALRRMVGRGRLLR
jgi:hypothetical protein